MLQKQLTGFDDGYAGPESKGGRFHAVTHAQHDGLVEAALAGFSPTPRIDSSVEAVLHYEDTNPAQISTVGTPNVVAAPVRSAFQTDHIVLRVLLDCAWRMREPGRVAFVNGVTWA
jgi:hypothetical protein